MIKTYEGVGPTLEIALERAQCQIPKPGNHKDFSTSKVEEWGLQEGGFTGSTMYYVIVSENRQANFKTENPCK